MFGVIEIAILLSQLLLAGLAAQRGEGVASTCEVPPRATQQVDSAGAEEPQPTLDADVVPAAAGCQGQ